MACGEPFPNGYTKPDIFKYMRFVIPGIILVLVAVFLVIYFTGPSVAVRKIMNGYRDNDPEAVIESYPSFFMESVLVDRETLINDVKFNVKVSSQYVHKYKLEKAQNPTESEREKLLEDIRIYGGRDFDVSDIKDIKIIWVTYDVDFAGVFPQAGLRFVMIKYEGRWCWWPDVVERYD
jgi:hypothetical protein